MTDYIQTDYTHLYHAINLVRKKLSEEQNIEKENIEEQNLYIVRNHISNQSELIS